MVKSGICSICGGVAEPAYTCMLCGAICCAGCFDASTGLCRNCAAKAKKRV